MPNMPLPVAISPVTAELLDLEEQGVEELATQLGARPPLIWPPDFNGTEYRHWQRGLLAKHPDEHIYAGWYIVGDGELVGTCGFKGPPNQAGEVEIGYSIIAPRQRRGYASAAAELLVARAFADPRVETVLAETPPDHLASQAVLARCGFKPIGTRLDPDHGDVLCFQRRRSP
jgi:ribosomal-protein-alanine N-acetyltransferase